MTKKIAIISSHAPSLVNFRAQLIQSLADSGFEVFALAPNYSESTRNAISAFGATPLDYKMSRAGMNPVVDIFNTLSLSRLLRQISPDMVLGYFIKPVIFGTLAAWIAGVRFRFAMIEGLGFVFTNSGTLPSLRRKILKRVVEFLYRAALMRARRVIFLNPDDLEEFVSKGMLPVEKAFLLGGIGVDLAEWRSVESVSQPVTFLMIARLLREKGILEYVEAARYVKALHPTSRFILLGDLDSNPGSLSRVDAEKWVSEGVLEWPGHVPVASWIERSSVFVLPSYREGVPRSSQEAMAMGRALISTDVPGCRETVVDGVNGFLVPARDPVALSGAMLRFIENPQLIADMGAESRRLAEERFDVHKINRRLINLLNKEAKI